MKKAVLLGILASFFFAFTFVLNRQMNLSGADWTWTAALRFFFMLPILAVLVLVRRQGRAVLDEIAQRPRAWLTWSTVGFGIFYAAICAASQYGPSWLLAASWQITIIAGALLSPLFGKRLPRRSLLLSLIILAGIFVLQWQESGILATGDLLLCLGLVLLAAFAYPLGNRKMMELCGDRIDTVQRVFGMTLCSLPCWLLLAAWSLAHGIYPSASQILQSGLVALFSGVIATLLFFQATHLVKQDSHQLAVVESTQSGEVVFSLLGGVLLFGDRWPSLVGMVGLVLVIAGMLVNSLLAKGKSP